MKRATIAELLANLILTDDVPLAAIALAGEVITAEAHMSDYDTGREYRKGLDRWMATAEVWEAALLGTQSAIEEYTKKRDINVLLASLQKVKADLTGI